jgi:DNA polymerase-1
MNRLVLIDGNAILHRAYHAIPPLNAPDGSVVNAVYGFATMLFRFAQTLQPTHIAVAFDRPKPTFRKKLFEGYQSKRPKMDEDLVSQIGKVHELVESFGIPIFEEDGYEADDLIGTLSKHHKGIDQIVIVTGDRDILQLVVDEKVMVFMPTKGISEGKLYSEKDVKERLGVSPSHVTDFKGLAGDSSDNYPGVAGIGPKTAISLIDTFGSVEDLYKALEHDDKRFKEFSDAVVQKLKAGKESAILFKDIATIRKDAPITGELQKVSSFDSPKARAFLEKMHFHSLLKRLGVEPKEEPKKKEAPKKEKPKDEQQALF